jgi:hypothetical protein
LAHLQLAALENLSRPVLPALSLIEGSSVEGAKLRERLESKMPITKLVDASQKNLAKQPAIPDTPAE